jgi:hypothetical protein
VLRGMVLPAGTHTIDFKFEPTVYVTGEKISLAGSVLLDRPPRLSCIHRSEKN